jgi:hypothetical protein
MLTFSYITATHVWDDNGYVFFCLCMGMLINCYII